MSIIFPQSCTTNCTFSKLLLCIFTKVSILFQKISSPPLFPYFRLKSKAGYNRAGDLLFHVWYIYKCTTISGIHLLVVTQNRFMLLYQASAFSSVARIALMKSAVLSTVTSSFLKVVISARSFVIFPDSIVSSVAFSSLSAKSTSSGI